MRVLFLFAYLMSPKKNWQKYLLKKRTIGVCLTVVILASILLLLAPSGRTPEEGLQYSECHGITISMATFGARVFKVEPVITSLIQQKTRADMIVVNVALNSRTDDLNTPDIYRVYQYFQHYFGSCIPNTTGLSGFIWCESKRAGKILIHFGTDYGPATKVLGTLRALPDLHEDSCIISVDDDVVYSSNLVSELTRRSNNVGAVGFSCEELPKSLAFFRTFNPSSVWWDIINENSFWRFPFDDVVHCKGWMHGYLGILYRKKFFAEDVFVDTNLPPGCFYHDDVRLAGYLAQKGVFRFVIPHQVIPWPYSQHMEKNPNDALSMIQDTMLSKQLPCVLAFEWK